MEVPVLSPAACTRCGNDLDSAVEPLYLPCRLATPAFERGVAYACFQDGMRNAIHSLKYDRMHPAARRLGRMLAQAIAQLAGGPPAMLMVPIPLHRTPQRERAFNQARLTGHAIQALGASHPERKLNFAPTAPMRLRATQSQASLTPRERRMSVRGAFSVCDPAAVKGGHILLIDDIFTTGATARAAARARARRAHQDTGSTNSPTPHQSGFAPSQTQDGFASQAPSASVDSTHYQPSS